MSPHDHVNASPITKITSWLKFLGKNLHLVGCATVCGKCEVMLVNKNAPSEIIRTHCVHICRSIVVWLFFSRQGGSLIQCFESLTAQKIRDRGTNSYKINCKWPSDWFFFHPIVEQIYKGDIKVEEKRKKDKRKQLC